MAATTDQLIALAAPTPKEEIGLIPGKGGSGALSYVTARFVQGRLDATVGPANWRTAFRIVGNSLTCTIGISCEDGLTKTFPRWVEKEDVGSESTIEAEKGSFSDAFKRAAVQWGVARDLYPGPKRTVAGDEEEKAGREERKRNRHDTTQDEPAQRVHGVPEDAARAAQDEPTETAKAAVVGHSGLTKAQKGLLFASLKGAGWAKKRKAAVFLMTSKNSVKDMNEDDLRRTLSIMAYYEAGDDISPEFDTVLANIESVAEDTKA